MIRKTGGTRWAIGLALAAALLLLVPVSGANASAAQSQALVVDVDGLGTVTASGINCRDNGAGDCLELYPTGTAVTLTATPDAGNTFTGWGGDCSGAATTCNLTMDTSKAVLAAFTAGGGGANRVLTVSTAGNGTVTGTGINCGPNSSGDCTETYANGTAVTLTATPSAGATFTGWGGSCAGNATTCNLTMDASKTVAATFSGGAPTATLSVTSNGNGTVSGTGINCGPNSTGDCSEAYAQNTVVTLTATPSAGATFTGWSGACTGAATTCNVTMDASKTVTATFTGGAAGTQPLSVSVTGSGTVTGPGITCGSGQNDCTENYATNTTVALTATPAAGATFTGWGGSCAGNSTTCTVTMSAARSVTASFTTSPTSQTLTVSVSGSGRVTGPGISCGSGATDCSETFATNTSVTLTATPDAGASFTGWGGSCAGAAATCTVVMSAGRTVSAGFTITTTANRTLTVVVTGSGKVTGPGINCGLGSNDCSQTFVNGTSVTLAATRLTSAVFLGWGGPCTGTNGTCTFTMDANRSVAANFSQSNGNNGGNNTGGLQATFLGQPLISRTSVGWAVTLRFRVNQAAAALLRLSLGGRLVNAFTFSPRRGIVIVGPFHLGTPGQYRFALELNNSRGARAGLVWNVCLSNNGCRQFRPAASLIRRGSANVVRVSGGWVVRARFTPTRAVRATVTMYRGGRAVSRGSFSFAGNRAVVLDVPTRARGTHVVRLVARDAAGRTTTVSWTVVVR